MCSSLKKSALWVLSFIFLSVNQVVADEVSLDALLEKLDPPGFADDVEGIKRSVDLNIQFKKSSAELTDLGKSHVEVLGESMLHQRMSDYIFFLVGHTDASGSEEYNKALSRERAFAVRTHLMEASGVPGNSLLAIAKGESELIEGLPKHDAKHRRVQVIAIDPKVWMPEFFKNGGVESDIIDRPEEPKKTTNGPVQINW